MVDFICLGRFNGGNISDDVLNGSSIHLQLDMTSKFNLVYFSCETDKAKVCI